jgi:hypothetical protein
MMNLKQRLAILVRTTCYLGLTLVMMLVGESASLGTLAQGPRDLRGGGEVAVLTPEPAEPAPTDAPAEPTPADVAPEATPSAAPSRSRFGVAVNAQEKPVSFYADLGDLEISWYQNWSHVPWWNKEIKRPEYIPGVQFVPTVGAWAYLEGKETDASLRDMISKCPDCFPDGTLWIIGNELQIDKFSWLREGVALNPPRAITPTEYAVKYKKYYDIIKGINFSFKIAVGVTYDKPPYWSEFLRETRLAYESLYGVRMPIDVYTMHAYMSDPPLKEVQLLVGNKRARMKEYGDQDKPLYMTETGALTDAAHNPYFTVDQIKAFMDDVFEYLATETSVEYGAPSDGFHMVQKWAWFALTAGSGSDPDYWEKTDLFEYQDGSINSLGVNYAAFEKGESLLPPWWAWGNIRKAGANVDTGTPVSAWIDNVRVASTDALPPYEDKSVYTLDVLTDDPDTAWRDGGNNGETVRFKVGSTWADQTGQFQWGASAPITLTIPAYGTHFDAAAQWATSYKNWGPQNRYPRLVADVSGDGKADAVGFDPTRGPFVGLSTGSAFAKPTQWSSDFAWMNDNADHRELGDVNGDGKADVVGFRPTLGVYVGLSTGTSFMTATLWSNAFSSYDSQTRFPRLVGDVNGDGKADIVAFAPTVGAYVGLSNGTSFDTPTLWTTDFGWTNDPFYHRVLADADGDGKADVVGFKYGDGVYVGLSTGTAFGAATKWYDGLKAWGPQQRYARHAADVNGDGLADLIAFEGGARGAFVALSTGNAFSRTVQWTTDFAWLGDNYNHREMGDVSGDGRADVVGFLYGTGVQVGVSSWN